MKIPKRQVSIGGEIFEIPDFTRLFGRWIWAVLILVVIVWLLSGFYMVNAGHVGIIRRFGMFVGDPKSPGTKPGIHWHLPYPIETVDKPHVDKLRRVEVGFRTIDQGPPARYSDRPRESIMLTGNLNIVDCDMIVQYRIIDPYKWLFKVRDLEITVQSASAAALRQVIGKHEIDEALTTGKSNIQEKTKEQIQAILDRYDAGLDVVKVQLQDVGPPEAVSHAFKDVASAKEDRERLIKQAEGYYNDLIPRTRGEAAKLVKGAEAWAAERITKAEGDAQNFIRILNEYHKAPDITRVRMLLETMEEILPGIQKYILKTDKNSNLMNVLGLPGTMDGSKGGQK